jgi:hypothetical protein
MSCGGGSGGGTNTIETSSAPPANVQQAYTNLTNAAFTQAGQPLQQYTNPLVAGFTPQQTQGFQETQNAQGMATPYINAAAQEFGQATTPFYQSEPAYQSPYTGQVTNALSGLFNQQNAQQQQQVNSNATAQGAFGGDRGAVANALTAQQQNLSEAPTMANVLQGGYQTALGAAEAQGYLGEQGGFGIGSLGTEAENSALTGASAELSSGGLQQQLEQEQLNVPYEQFQSAQAYPWQVLGELSPIVSGTGSLSGGTGSTTYPGPSMVSQLGGLGIAGLGTYGLLNSTGALSGIGNLFGGGAAASGDALASAVEAGGSAVDAGAGTALGSILGDSLFAKTGGRIGFADGGGIGGADISASSLPPVPTINLDYLVHPGPLTKGSGPPKAPQGNPDQFQGQTPTQELQMFSGLDKMVGESGIGAGSAFGGRTRTHHDDGGPTPLMQSSLVGLPPQLQNAAQQFQNMPLDQLQNMAARMPPGSPYGAVVQKVLQMRRMSPGNTTNAVSSASGVPIGTGAGQVPQQQGGIGNQQQPNAGGISTLNPPQGQGQGYAAGGGPIIQDEPDMDPHPVVDHSGPTVVVRYPSEGKALDLGIPSSPGRRTLAAGGAGGTVTPGPATVIGSGASSAQPFLSSVTAPNGIALPQLSMDAFAAPGGPGSMTPTAGGGLGTWANPLPQIGTPGSWSQVAPQTPGIAALESAFGGAGGGAAGPAATAASPAPATSPSVATGNPGSPATVQSDLAAGIDPATALPFAAPNANSKSGGRTGLQEGGDADSDSVPGVTVAPDSPLAAGNGFGSPDLGPAAAVVTPAGGIVTPTAPASAPTTPTSVPSVMPPPEQKPAAEVAQEVKPGPAPAVRAQAGQVGQQSTPSDFGSTPQGEMISGSESGHRNIPNYQFDPTHTAGGHYQITDTNWQHYAPTVGIDLKQWPNALSAPEQLQGQVAGKMYAETGIMPWAGNPVIARATGVHAPGTSGPPDQVIGGRGGIGTSDAGMSISPSSGGIGATGEPSSGIGGAGVALPPPRTAPSAQWAQSPWMIPIAIGAGMMSGRSSHPLVNVGEGMIAGVKTAEQQGEQGTRAAALENEAANRQATLGVEAQRLQQTGQYQTGELKQRNDEFVRQMTADAQRFDIQSRQADTAAARADASDKAALARAARDDAISQKPLPTYNPRTGDVGSTNAAQGYAIPEGWTIGRPPAVTGEQAIYNRLMDSGAAKDEQEAIQVAAAAKANPDAFKRSAQYAGLVEREEGSLRQAPMMAAKPDAEIQAEAQRRVDQLLASQGTPAASQRPTASAAAPATSQGAPAWTHDHPLVPRTQADIDNAPPGSVIQTPNGLMVKPQPQQQIAP